MVAIRYHSLSELNTTKEFNPPNRCMSLVVLPSASRRARLGGRRPHFGRGIWAGWARTGIAAVARPPAILRRPHSPPARLPEGLFCLRMSQVLCGEILPLPYLPSPFSLRSFTTGSARHLHRKNATGEEYSDTACIANGYSRCAGKVLCQ